MATQCPRRQFENTSDSKFCKECSSQLLHPDEVFVTKILEIPIIILTKDCLEIPEQLKTLTTKAVRPMNLSKQIIA